MLNLSYLFLIDLENTGIIPNFVRISKSIMFQHGQEYEIQRPSID